MADSPSTRPRASRIGDIVRLTGTRVPSARRRSMSICVITSPRAARARMAACASCSSGGTRR
jgi:hypothetical protein